MMKLLRLSNTKLMASIALEAGLIFAVLYALAIPMLALTHRVLDETPGGAVLMASIVFAGILLVTRHRNLRSSIGLRREFIGVFALCLVLGLTSFLAISAITSSTRSFSAWLMLVGAFAVPAVALTWRWTAVQFRVFEGYRERILILGTGETAKKLCRFIVDAHGDEFGVVGFAAMEEGRDGEILAMGTRVLTNHATMPEFCRSRVDRVIVALDEKRGVLPIEPLMQMRLSGMEIEDATSFVERTSGKIAVETLLPSWLIFSDGFKTSPVRAFLKRLSDILLSLALITVTAPIMLLTSIIIKIESPGPLLFRQRRMGRGGREFELLKFRSMVQDAEKRSGPAWATPNDPRVTRIGRLIRKVRIDELPQLWNVLRGEMSFVGPRPERRHFVEQLKKEIPFFDLRLAVRPGLTGWAQVQYGYGSTVDENREKLKYDLFYIKNLSFFLDFWIVMKTVKVVLQGSGAR